MAHFFKHLRIYMFRGLLAVIPLALTFAVFEVVYKLIDKKIVTFVEQYIDIRHIPGLGIVLLMLSLYLIGLIVSSLIGRQILHAVGTLIELIPFIKYVHQMGKQLSESFATASDKQAFQKVLLIKDLNHNGWMIGLLTGNVKDNVTGDELLRVFIPATHNPLL
ncbi:MAG: DUF502 domain-containing protein, partial [Candidatus Omnitrophota bacterium]